MDVFAAIADPVRRDLLRDIGAGTVRVVDLASGRPISRPAVSKHLRVLSDAGLVTAEDVGRERHYRVRAGGLSPVGSFLAELTPPGAPPPVTEAALAALDLEVRRTGRDRRAVERTRHRPAGPPHRDTGETA